MEPLKIVNAGWQAHVATAHDHCGVIPCADLAAVWRVLRTRSGRALGTRHTAVQPPSMTRTWPVM